MVKSEICCQTALRRFLPVRDDDKKESTPLLTLGTCVRQSLGDQWILKRHILLARTAGGIADPGGMIRLWANGAGQRYTLMIFMGKMFTNPSCGRKTVARLSFFARLDPCRHDEMPIIQRIAGFAHIDQAPQN